VINRLETVKHKLERVEIEAFYRRITSLQSNIVYWTNRLGHELASERQEADKELKRCNDLLKLVDKDLKKAEGKP